MMEAWALFCAGSGLAFMAVALVILFICVITDIIDHWRK